MATLRDLKGRIGSVGSSEKITGAMKMISSAKMHKAEMAIRRLLPFRTQLESIMGNLLAADAEFVSPLTVAREVRTVGIVVLGSDVALCDHACRGKNAEGGVTAVGRRRRYG